MKLFHVYAILSIACYSDGFVPAAKQRPSSLRGIRPLQGTSSLGRLSGLLESRNSVRRSRCDTRLSSSSEKTRNGSNSQGGWLSLSERTKGLAVLLTVPIAWGTYVPVVRYLYEIQPAVPGFVFSACYYAVASLTTLSIVAIQHSRSKRGSKHISQEVESTSPASLEDEQPASSSFSSFPIMGGLELGLYLFVANCLQVLGLKTVPSDRAGFLVQLTTVMVPVLEALLAGNLLAVNARTWFSCLLAFTGISVMNLEGIIGGQASIASFLTAFGSFTKGDVLIISAAVLYTLHVVRLGRYARETTPLKLAAAKATVETVLSSGLVLALMSLAGSATMPSFVTETGAEIANFFSTISKGIVAGTVPKSAIISAVGATLWTGLVTCAYTIFAQSFGQKRVGPTDANLIYSIQPICTALFAFFLLGETMGPAGVVGGAFIGAAVYLVTGADSSDQEEDKDVDDDDDAYEVQLSPNDLAAEQQRNRTEVLIRRR